MTQKLIICLIVLVAFAAAVHQYFAPPWHMGFRGEEAIGIHKFGAVSYDTDPVGNIVIYDRLGGPLFALQLISDGAPWLRQ